MDHGSAGGGTMDDGTKGGGSSNGGDELRAFRAALDAVLPAALERRAETVEGCAVHLAAVIEANRHLNLTRIVEPHEAAVKHVLDSILPAALLEPGEVVVDLGSGAGFPGVPLHHHRPDLDVTLAESVGKKAAFLTQYAAAHAPSLKVVARRAEELLVVRPCTTIVARAAGKLAELVRYLDRARGRYRRILLWKGPSVEEEVSAASAELSERSLVARVVERYELPDGMGQRCLLEVSPSGKGAARGDASSSRRKKAPPRGKDSLRGGSRTPPRKDSSPRRRK